MEEEVNHYKQWITQSIHHIDLKQALLYREQMKQDELFVPHSLYGNQYQNWKRLNDLVQSTKQRDHPWFYCPYGFSGCQIYLLYAIFGSSSSLFHPFIREDEQGLIEWMLEI